MNTIDFIYNKLLNSNLSNDIIKLILKFLYCEYTGCKNIIYRYYVPNVFIGFGNLDPCCGVYCKKHYQEIHVFLTNN